MTWLVTGGAGYVGGHVVDLMLRDGRDVVVLDDLSTGDRGRLDERVPFELGSVGDARVLERVFSTHEIVGVVHLAAKKRCDESLEQPMTYFYENVEALRLLLDACVGHGVRQFVFSSSAAVYGASSDGVVSEATPCDPVNVYGQTKLTGEWLVHAVGAVSGISTVALRYFNVAGAASPRLADRQVENVVQAVLAALHDGRPPVIFGDDYPTHDGTCVRDYVHVRDVADAHVAAISAMETGGVSGESINVGTGSGTSVREVVDTALRVTGLDVSPVVGARRPGDAPEVVAAVDRAVTALQWKSQHDLGDMVRSAWEARSSAEGSPR